MKNKIYLIIILLVSLFSSFFVIRLYSEKLSVEEENLFLNKPYSQINILELKNYLFENANLILYVNNLKTSEQFQRELGEVVLGEDFVGDVLFMDGRNLHEKDINYLKSIYRGVLNFDVIDFKEDNIIKIKDRFIVDFIEINEATTLSAIENFLENKDESND